MSEDMEKYIKEIEEKLGNTNTNNTEVEGADPKKILRGSGFEGNNWVSGYPEEDISKHTYLTKLVKLEEQRNRTLYKMVHSDNRILAVFDNQYGLFSYIEDNIDSVFEVKFMKSKNRKFSYSAIVDDEKVDTYTIAKVRTSNIPVPDELGRTIRI